MLRARPDKRCGIAYESEITSFTASNLEEYIEKSIEYCWKLPSTWDSSDFGEKLKIQKRIFPEGFYYNKKNGQPRTTKINPVFSQIARLKGVSEESETGSSEDKFKNSGLVASTGLNNLLGINKLMKNRKLAFFLLFYVSNTLL